MSPRRIGAQPSPRVEAEVHRLALLYGMQVRDARQARGWSVAELGRRSGLSPDMVYRIEAGQPGSLDAFARLAVALGRTARLELIDPRRRDMRPISARILCIRPWASSKRPTSGRSASTWVLMSLISTTSSRDARISLHGTSTRGLCCTSRTGLDSPTSRRWPALSTRNGPTWPPTSPTRAGVPSWRSETHVIAALWSSEVLHALRLRTSSFRALCPDSPETFSEWWAGRPPKAGATSTIIVLDPLASPKRRAFVGLDDALGARPRYRGYADAAVMLARNALTSAASKSG